MLLLDNYANDRSLSVGNTVHTIANVRDIGLLRTYAMCIILTKQYVLEAHKSSIRLQMHIFVVEFLDLSCSSHLTSAESNARQGSANIPTSSSDKAPCTSPALIILRMLL